MCAEDFAEMLPTYLPKQKCSLRRSSRSGVSLPCQVAALIACRKDARSLPA